MLLSVWSHKGGQGVSTVAALTALAVAQTEDTVLVDLSGDMETLLNSHPARTVEGHDYAMTEWSRDTNKHNKTNLLYAGATEVTPRLKLIHRGAGQFNPSVTETAFCGLMEWLKELPNVIVDAGTLLSAEQDFVLGTALRERVVAHSDTNWMVTKPTTNAWLSAHDRCFKPGSLIVVEHEGAAFTAETFGKHLLIGHDHSVALAWSPEIVQTVDRGLTRYNTDDTPTTAEYAQRLHDQYRIDHHITAQPTTPAG